MFDPITHPWDGTTRMFMPQGKSPFALTDQIITGEGVTVLCNGDAVTVEGAFTRPYMARTAPIVLYVRSHRTGLATYVLESEVNLDLRRLYPVDGWAKLEQTAKRVAELLDDPDRERKVWEMILASLDSLDAKVSETPEPETFEPLFPQRVDPTVVDALNSIHAQVTA